MESDNRSLKLKGVWTKMIFDVDPWWNYFEEDVKLNLNSHFYSVFLMVLLLNSE